MEKRVSIIGELFVTTKNMFKCSKCGEESNFTINENVYICFDKGRFVWKCPHCKTEYRIDLAIDFLEDK